MSHLHLSTKSEDNHSGSNSHLDLTPDGLGRLSRIFVAIKFEMSTVTGPSLSRLGKLESETVVGARVCPADLAIERGLSESEELTTGLA